MDELNFDERVLDFVWDFVRFMECGVAVAAIKVAGERGNAIRRMMAEIMVELIEEHYGIPDDPKEALLALVSPFAEARLDGDVLEVRDCRLCYSAYLKDVAKEKELEIIRKVPPCPFKAVFDVLASKRGWDVTLKPLETPLSGETEPGSCRQKLVEG